MSFEKKPAISVNNIERAPIGRRATSLSTIAQPTGRGDKHWRKAGTTCVGGWLSHYGTVFSLASARQTSTIRIGRRTDTAAADGAYGAGASAGSRRGAAHSRQRATSTASTTGPTKSPRNPNAAAPPRT